MKQFKDNSGAKEQLLEVYTSVFCERFLPRVVEICNDPDVEFEKKFLALRRLVQVIDHLEKYGSLQAVELKDILTELIAINKDQAQAQINEVLSNEYNNLESTEEVSRTTIQYYREIIDFFELEAPDKLTFNGIIKKAIRREKNNNTI